jgi:hypothetical protein
MPLGESPRTASHRARGAHDARTRDLDAMEREGTRARRRLLWETLLGCVFCCALGLFLVSWAVHTTNASLGGISFWTGLLVGDIGMITLLMRYFQRIGDVG